MNSCCDFNNKKSNALHTKHTQNNALTLAYLPFYLLVEQFIIKKFIAKPCEFSEEAAIPVSSEPRVSVWEYKEVSLWCNATGVPEPKVTWYVLETTNQQTEALRGTCIRISLDVQLNPSSCQDRKN